ncbi:MAG: hypothetical protein HY718_02605 [Planctomycetes bacterium]|nr:hypothetical protein [Planctomycetota bacterium]
MTLKRFGILTLIVGIGLAVPPANGQESGRGGRRGFSRDRRQDEQRNDQQAAPNNGGPEQPRADDGESRRERGRDSSGDGGRGSWGERGRDGPRDGGPGFGGDRGRGFWGDRGPDSSREGGRGPRGDWRDRRGPPTPEERAEFENRMVERNLERMTRYYELSDDQQAQVRTRLDELKAQHQAGSEKRMQEFQSLRSQMEQLRSARDVGGQVDEQEEARVRDRMRALWRESPLMNSDTVTGEVEKVLPSEQVERGRANRQAESQEWDRRREEMRQRWEERRRQEEQESGQTPPNEPAGPPPPPFSPDGAPPPRSWRDAPPPGEWDGDRDSRRRDWEQRRDEYRRRRGEDGGPSGTEQPGEGGRPGESRPDSRSRRAIVENPIGPWEQYVRDFVRQFGLDPAQQATAYSVLREVETRRVAYEQSHRVDFEQARQLTDGGQREKRLAELNQPVVRMFDELKGRLNRIPSAAQRQAAGVSPPTSQPAGATSRPAYGSGRSESRRDRDSREDRRSDNPGGGSGSRQ